MKMQIPPVATQFFAFNGGLDLVSPPIEISNGALRSGSNIEIGVNGGYATVGGYERYDGRPKPSAASYTIVNATITGSYAVGNTLTGVTSGATGVICTTGVSGQFILTKVSGTFQVSENLQISAVTVAVSAATEVIGAAATPALDAEYYNLAADIYRADIGVVPGSGNILGVHQYNGTVYAFRNNAGGTAAVMHVKSGSGWTAVALGREVAFTSGGTYTMAVGDTITGATSGATAVLTKVILTSGTFGAGTAAGRLFFASQTGTFQSENLNVGANLNVATIAGNSTAITLSPSGRYEFDNANFGGGTGTKKMYGADGVNKGFEFDGSVFVKINTGMTTDTPKHVKVHKNQLFFSFGGSAQHSGVGDPYTFAPISGAGELACGDTITGFLGLPGNDQGGALAIYTSNSTSVLYGNDTSDWNIVKYSDEAGAIAYTTQYLRQGMAYDSQGIISLGATQNFGNFNDAVISDKIAPWIRRLTSSACSSCIVRNKNQYRLFFNDGKAVYVTAKGSKILGMTPVELTDQVLCISSLEGASGTEEMYFGSDNGYVYQMDIGTSFDGGAIAWRAELAFNHFGSPRQLKQFKKAVTEITGAGYGEFDFTFTLGYSSSEYESSPTASQGVTLSNATWDSFTWDRFFWDSRSLAPAEADVTGTAENISLLYSGSSDEFQPITLNSAIIHYIQRRAMR